MIAPSLQLHDGAGLCRSGLRCRGDEPPSVGLDRQPGFDRGVAPSDGQPSEITIAGKPMDTYHRWVEVGSGPTLAGLPTVNVPAGSNAAGLPMGLQVMGKAQADLAVLQMAYAYEQATQWVQKRKPSLL